MDDIQLRRSILYIPGSNSRAIEKARILDADCLIFDLEDSVAPAIKQDAREQICDALTGGGFGSREIIVRINGLDTPWGRDDFKAIVKSGPGAVLIPKVNGAEDVLEADRALVKSGASENLRLWAMMETPEAMLNAASIASAANGRLAVMVMGTNDLARDLRARPGKKRKGLLPYLCHCIAAARANGLDIVDGVFNDLEDAKGFAAQCRQGYELGMDGKTLIHPNQIGPCNKAFSPSEKELIWASAVIAAFDDAENRDKGALRVDGRMVEQLHLDIALRMMAAAGSIRKASH